MSAGLAWLAAGLSMLIAEVVAPGVFLMWLGLAAIATGGVTLAARWAFAWQCALFAVLAPVLVLVGRRMVRARVAHVNTPHSGLVGRRATALAFEGDEGRVRIGDSDWPARLPPGTEAPAPGTALRVQDVSGLVLLVEHVTPTSPSAS